VQVFEIAPVTNLGDAVSPIWQTLSAKFAGASHDAIRAARRYPCTAMIIDLAPAAGDDPAFTQIVSTIAAALVRDTRPRELRTIRIAGWFEWV